MTITLSPEQAQAAIEGRTLWRRMDLPSERDELRSRLELYRSRYESVDDSDLPAEALALQARLQEIDQLEEKAAQVERYRTALKRPGLDLETRTYLEQWLKLHSDAAPAEEKLPPIEPVKPVQNGENWTLTLPGDGTAGSQVYHGKNLTELCTIVGYAQMCATRQIRKLKQEMKRVL